MSAEVWLQNRHVDGLYGVVALELNSSLSTGAELAAELVGRPVMTLGER